jgi:MFS family permease
VLLLLNTVNFYDRLVIAAVVEPLRREWRLGDAQVGWLGTAFTLLYALAGVPLGRLADVWSRRALLAAGAFVWSATTTLSGLAGGFASLFAARLVVGVGEAVCAPAATSLLGDLFPSERRGRATAIFMLGLPLGVGLSYALSGAVAQTWGWRAAFLVAGVPGLVAALLCSRLSEPVRGAAEGQAIGGRKRAGSRLVLLARTPTFRWLVLSGAIHNFNMYALSLFLPALLTRRHGLGVGAAGALSGLVFGVVGGLGMLAGGWTSDHLAARRENGRLVGAALALGVSAPLALGFLVQPPGALTATVVLLCAAVLLMYVYYAPVYATLQDVFEPSLRGTAIAVYFFAMYLLGASLGPVATGALSDALAARAAAGGLAIDQARSAGLHQAMFLVPALGVVLAAVLAAGARTLREDRRALLAWMARDAGPLRSTA